MKNQISKNKNYKEGRNMNKKMDKKKNSALLIDGENISYKKAESILSAAKKQGVLDMNQVRVYGLQKDTSTKGWSEKAKELGIRDIRLCGGPLKDKVDRKIQKDALNMMNTKNINTVCISTSDKGYVGSINELRKGKKQVVVIGEAKAPVKLRDACNRFVEV